MSRENLLTVRNKGEAAINWIIDNQLGRRNLTPEQRDYLLGKKYNREKKAPVGFSDRDVSGGQNVQGSTTAEKLAEQYKVDEKTVRRAGQFAEAVISF